MNNLIKKIILTVAILLATILPNIFYGDDNNKKIPVASQKSPLDGDTLYKQNCTRCHMKPEFKFLGFVKYTDGQINTIVKHMRVRANIPEEEAKAILEYLTQ